MAIVTAFPISPLGTAELTVIYLGIFIVILLGIVSVIRSTKLREGT
jgi:hypothetical protein